MTETSELIKSPEGATKSSFDAILVHGYWLSQKGTDSRVDLSLRSHIEDRVAAILYDGGKGAGKLVLTAGHIWGPDYPSVAELMAEELVRKYKVPREDIIVKTEFIDQDGNKREVTSTHDEVSAFLELRRNNGWTNIADLAARTHDIDIPWLYKKVGEDVKIDAAEDILNAQNDRRIKKLLNHLGRSKYEWSFRFYEGAKVFFHLIDPDYKRLNKMTAKARSIKGDLRPPLLPIPIDKYSK